MIKFDLSELPISPQQYRLMGVISIVVGVALLILGLVFVVMTETRRAASQNLTKISADECLQRIAALGMHGDRDGDKIRIQDKGMAQGVTLLAKSSQIAGLCLSWTLQDYCLGAACAPPGLTMTLQYHDPQKS